MNLLSLGSVVRLQNGERKLMVISRTPLREIEGIVGYFDYAACVYPIGFVNQLTYFFNAEDIAEVCFDGYVDEEEEKFRTIYEEEIAKVAYPKLTIQN